MSNFDDLENIYNAVSTLVLKTSCSFEQSQKLFKLHEDVEALSDSSPKKSKARRELLWMYFFIEKFALPVEIVDMNPLEIEPLLEEANNAFIYAGNREGAHQYAMGNNSFGLSGTPLKMDSPYFRVKDLEARISDKKKPFMKLREFSEKRKFSEFLEEAVKDGLAAEYNAVKTYKIIGDWSDEQTEKLADELKWEMRDNLFL
jgi:hypothetical protein